MEALFILIFVFVISIYNAISWGYVASVFYGWFILPSFPTLPNFTYFEFVGFILFIGVITHKHSPSIKEEYKDSGSDLIQEFFGPWLTLIFGWIIHNLIV